MNQLQSRIAISGIFFLHGLCFSTWGARIPTIQEFHHLTDGALGTILLAIPAGSILTTPLAAMLTSYYGSRKSLIASITLYSVVLITLGLAQTETQLLFCLFFFGMASNMVNVSLNTQAISIEAIYERPIMSSLHGLWSLAGFVGAACGAIMIGQRVVPSIHFTIITMIVLVSTLWCSRNLLTDSPADKKRPQFSFQLPDKTLLGLGFLAFCSMLCEGAMFDWSGIYFKKVVKAEGGWIGAGYVAFMTTMAGTRFFADRFKVRYGAYKLLVTSGLFIFMGLTISVLFPRIGPALMGFFIVGCGVSAVVPLAFSEAGKVKSTNPSSAIAAVSTIGFLGFLLGPPLIGWIAEASSLKMSFLVIACFGLVISGLAIKVKR